MDDHLAATEAIMSNELIIHEIIEAETANENEEDGDSSEQVTDPEIAKPKASKD